MVDINLALRFGILLLEYLMKIRDDMPEAERRKHWDRVGQVNDWIWGLIAKLPKKDGGAGE